MAPSSGRASLALERPEVRTLHLAIGDLATMLVVRRVQLHDGGQAFAKDREECKDPRRGVAVASHAARAEGDENRLGVSVRRELIRSEAVVVAGCGQVAGGLVAFRDQAAGSRILEQQLATPLVLAQLGPGESAVPVL